MNTTSNKKLWFKAKTYGWGWTPCSWEGWLTIALFVLFIVLDFRHIDTPSYSVSDRSQSFFIDTFLALSLLIIICFYKGEKPRWSWGNKKNKL